MALTMLHTFPSLHNTPTPQNDSNPPNSQQNRKQLKWWCILPLSRVCLSFQHRREKKTSSSVIQKLTPFNGLRFLKAKKKKSGIPDFTPAIAPPEGTWCWLFVIFVRCQVQSQKNLKVSNSAIICSPVWLLNLGGQGCSARGRARWALNFGYSNGKKNGGLCFFSVKCERKFRDFWEFKNMDWTINKNFEIYIVRGHLTDTPLPLYDLVVYGWSLRD